MRKFYRVHISERKIFPSSQIRPDEYDADKYFEKYEDAISLIQKIFDDRSVYSGKFYDKQNTYEVVHIGNSRNEGEPGDWIEVDYRVSDGCLIVTNIDITEEEMN